MARFLVVPQWQGSPSSRAMALVDGAQAIAGDLPRAACVQVDVPLEAGDALGSAVLRASALVRVQAAMTDALLTEHAPVIVIGGDCSVAIPAIGHVAGDDLAVVWFDAHPDANDAQTSPSGAFAGMALRAVVDDIVVSPEISLGLPAGTVRPDHVVLVSGRAVDEQEAAWLDQSTIRRVPATATAEEIAEAVTATGATRVYIHVDLDVLDPAAIAGVAFAEPFGMAASSLVESIRAIRDVAPLAGSSVTGFAPASPAAAVDDLGTILRVIGALA